MNAYAFVAACKIYMQNLCGMEVDTLNAIKGNMKERMPLLERNEYLALAFMGFP